MITAIIIDDESDQVDSMSNLLSNNNIETIGTGVNGKDAVKLYKKLNPDVVLLDILMPEYDGNYAIDKIKEFDANAKIIAITADVSEITSVNLRDKQIQYLYKPFESDDIIAQIEFLVRN